MRAGMDAPALGFQPLAAAPAAGHRLRILMVTHTRWNRNLGAARVQLELAEELRTLGDSVEKFSHEDAFPGAPPGRGLPSLLRSNRSFAARARAAVRANAHRFDVIDAHQTNLPFSKSDLRFEGLLVARSVGLVPAYREFERATAQRNEPFSAREALRRFLTYPGRRRHSRDVTPSFRFADLVNLPNHDELGALRSDPTLAPKLVVFPFGMSESRLLAFRAARFDAEARRRACLVAFIGAWSIRKGAGDWPEIIRGIVERIPSARFLFLGTGFGRDVVLRQVPAALRGRAEVVPAYDSENLPQLLAGATVGTFPGYLEGFPFGVLEQLAAGLPTVTYDAPGSREMMSMHSHANMVPAGDVERFCAAVAELLSLSPRRYREHSRASMAVAARFRWREIAQATRSAYFAALAAIRKESV